MTYRLLQCQGCEAYVFQTGTTNANDKKVVFENLFQKTVFNETLRHYPPVSSRSRPGWISTETWTGSQKLRDLTAEMYSALDNDLPVLAAIAMRTVFDVAIELLGIRTEKSFEKKLAKMVELGKIGSDERKHLDALVNAGSAAAHRGWKPSSEQLDAMAHVLEGFLHRVFVAPQMTEDLQAVVPRRT